MDKNIRIAIIGGGPAGIAAGMYLEKRGYDNYVIYEKSDHVGGKCHSPHHDGKRYEMGAIMGCPTYYAVHEMEIFGGTSHEGGPRLEHGYMDYDGNKDYRYTPSLLHPLRTLHLLKVKKHVERLGKLLETKYKGYDVCGHRGVAEGRYDGYEVSEKHPHISGENPNLKDLAMPFDEFLKMNKCELAREVWIQPFTSFGYGYYDEIPAAYVLKYTDFATMMYFAHDQLWTWIEGTQSIYENANAKLKHPAILNANVEKVVRGDKVVITVNGVEETFDKIIITAPLQVATEKNPLINPIAVSLDTWLDVTDEERELFSKIDYERYDTTAYLTKPENYPDGSYYQLETWTPEHLGEVMIFYRRWKNEKNQPIVHYTMRHHKTFNDGKELDYEETQKKAVKNMEKLGVPMEKEIYRMQSYYFPHVFSEDYAAGWYDKVEAMQGKNNTYYAGEVMSFGDMEETVSYSRELIDRFFAE